MNQSNKNKKHKLTEIFITAKDWILDHNKIVMPLVLIICVLITVLIAVNANQKEALIEEAQTATAVPDAELLTDFELEENAHPEINNLIRTYYDAQVAGDMETISSLNTYLNDIEKIRVAEMSKYLDSYVELNVYTKPGLTENTYVAYVCSEVLFKDLEQQLPGMQTYYIGLNEDGNYFINDGTYDETIRAYITEMSLQDDVVDLNNKIVVAYNELLAEDEELSEYIAYLKEKINEDVGEILAEVEQPEEVPAENTETAQANPETDANTIKIVRTTDVVNIRSSDSEEAEKIDKAQLGQEFTLLEQKGNGWSKVEYDNGEAYIKSDYLEVVSEEVTETADANTGTEQDDADNDAEDEQETESAENVTTSGTVKAIDSVKVRKGASKDSESLGTIYAGEELELIMKQADGWTKVKYKGQVAYVKSEYVE